MAQSDDAAGGSGSAQSLGEGVTKSTATGQTTTSSPTFRERFADQLARFGVVVLARAREVSGAVQKFAVLRIFKGSAAKTVELVVNDDPADRGRLHLLLLDPHGVAAAGGAERRRVAVAAHGVADGRHGVSTAARGVSVAG